MRWRKRTENMPAHNREAAQRALLDYVSLLTIVVSMETMLRIVRSLTPKNSATCLQPSIWCDPHRSWHYRCMFWQSLTGRDWMRRLDHSMIFVLIAGSYTPFAVLVLHGPLAVAIFVGVWAGAGLGVAFNLVWRDAPTWLRSALYVGLGWIAVAAVPQLGAAIGPLGLTLLGLGGVLYTLGAVVYAVRAPDPVPAVFGYHEVFHILVIAAAALQYAVIVIWIAPR
jgi:channel protein (hemolysin III family)